MRLINCTTVLTLLLFGSVTHAQYAADGSKTTFISILKGVNQSLNYTDFVVTKTENSLKHTRGVLDGVRAVRLSIESWTRLIEKLSDLGNIAMGTAIATSAILIIGQVAVFCYGKVKSYGCCHSGDAHAI